MGMPKESRDVLDRHVYDAERRVEVAAPATQAVRDELLLAVNAHIRELERDLAEANRKLAKRLDE